MLFKVAEISKLIEPIRFILKDGAKPWTTLEVCKTYKTLG